MRIHNQKKYVSCFDEDTGQYCRIGKKENGFLTMKDPFMADFPELLDIGIMGHCEHGKSCLCLRAGVECYQNGALRDDPNMSLTDFRNLIDQCKGKTYQVALGGCGDPDQHEHFGEILQYCRENGIVPNFTTSGYGMTEEKAALCREYCGAVAVSWYRGTYTWRTIFMLRQQGVKTNIHFVLSQFSLHEALLRLKGQWNQDEKGFPEGINAVIFLLHKPVGFGTKRRVLTRDNDELQEFLELVDNGQFPFKVGFDSCTVPALMGLPHTVYESLDACEAARWSAYISHDLKMMPCSFCWEKEGSAVDLTRYSIQEAWDSPIFEAVRKRLREACPGCGYREYCMGGCPIIPEIVLCSKKRGGEHEVQN